MDIKQSVDMWNCLEQYSIMLVFLFFFSDISRKNSLKHDPTSQHNVEFDSTADWLEWLSKDPHVIPSGERWLSEEGKTWAMGRILIKL